MAAPGWPGATSAGKPWRWLATKRASTRASRSVLPPRSRNADATSNPSTAARRSASDGAGAAAGAGSQRSSASCTATRSRWRAACHSLRGAAGTLGALRLLPALAPFEDALRVPASPPALAAQAALLNRQLVVLVDRLALLIDG